MKHLLSVLMLSVFIFGSQTTYAVEKNSTSIVKEESKKVETKKACIDQTQKDGKVKQVCKEVKVHKKLEGTPVPPAKK